jgi:hypothetical protein
MKALNVQDRLEFARCAVAVLRALTITGQTMRYEQFGRAIGLIADSEPWQVHHRQQTTAILNITAAVERYALGGKDKSITPLEYDRIVTKSGKPGAGFTKHSRIRTTKS